MSKNEKDKQYYSILQWITECGIVNEKGEAFDFYDRPWLIDILTDWTPNIALMACAQVGKSVTFSIKTLFAIKHLRFNAIYTMSSSEDVQKFVASKFNPIIQANHHEFAGMDTDNIERKEFDKRFVFFQGTNSKTAGVSDTADILIHDEISRSDQVVIERFKSRTKASPYRGRWMFSNPGTERDELDLQHQKSDQKEWHVTCPHCAFKQVLLFPDDVDMERKCYVCRECKGGLSSDNIRQGKWIDRDGVEWTGVLNPRYKVSGWRISHLMCPWIPVEDIIEDSEGDPAYFNNFVLGKAYSPGDLSVSKTTILDLWTPKDLMTKNIFLGVDVGNIKHYVIRSEKGLLKMGRFTKDSELDDIIRIWKPTSGVIDAMPNTTLSRYVVETYPFMNMSYFQENSNNPQLLVWWGEGEKKGIVYSFRDRILDQFLTAMIEAKWLIGVPSDEMFRLYIKHFETLRREKVVNNRGIERYCFVAGTKITTNTGKRNIEDLEVGDRVLTRNGFRQILDTISREACVVDMGILCGTPDHPVFTDIGLQQLLSIPLDANIYQWQASELYTKVLFTLDTLMQRTSQTVTTLDPQRKTEKEDIRGFTNKFIRTVMVIYQMVLSFIIKTIIHLTIRQRTWKHCIEKSTTDIISQSTTPTQSGQGIGLLREKEIILMESINGKRQRRHADSLSNTREKISLQKKQDILFARSAGKSVRHDTREVESIVPRLAETNGSVSTIGKRQKVYNLTIEDTPEYFANDILVHNCWASTTGEDHFVFADLYSYLAMLGAGSGTFFREATDADKPSILGSDNVYDVSRMFEENNVGYAE